MLRESNPLRAPFYADNACQCRARIVENVQLARDTYRVRFECPQIARRIVPGQFLMVRLADVNDPLLGRPLALYDVMLDAAGEPCGNRRCLPCAGEDDQSIGRVRRLALSSMFGDR